MQKKKEQLKKLISELHKEIHFKTMFQKVINFFLVPHYI